MHGLVYYSDKNCVCVATKETDEYSPSVNTKSDTKNGSSGNARFPKKKWHCELESLRSEYHDIIKKHPDAGEEIKQLCKVLEDTVSLVGCTPANVGESAARM
jgi:hypothetical protein